MMSRRVVMGLAVLASAAACASRLGRDAGGGVAATASPLARTASRGSTSSERRPFFPLLERGSRGRPVQMVQAMLDVSVDGEFGDSTAAAVARFQQRVGMEPDAVMDDPAWLRLLRVLDRGSVGPLVVAVQLRLDINATGEFTEETRTAVVSFQKSVGMAGSGSVELLTWQALLHDV